MGNSCADGLQCYGGVQGPCAQLNELPVSTGYPGADTPAGRQLILDFYSNPNRGYNASDFPHNDFAPFGGNEPGYPPGQTAFEHYSGRAMDCTAGLEGNSANFVHEVLLGQATAVDDHVPPLNLSESDFEGFVCQVDERVGGEVVLSSIPAPPSNFGSSYGCSNTHTDRKQQVYVFNPPIGFADGSPPPHLLDVNGDDDATLQRIPPAGEPKEILRAEYSYEERRTGIADTVLLAGLRVSCELGEKAGSHFLRHRDRYYRRDVRMQTLDNSLERPARRADVDVGRRAQCPKTPRTFLNEHSCRREPSCAATRWSSVPLTLNASTLQTFYTEGSVMMYAIVDMPLNPSRCHSTHGCYESPCGAQGNGQYGEGTAAMGWVVAGSPRPQDWMRSRWLRLDSCAGDNSPTALDNSTEACLSAAIRYAGTAEGRAKFLETDTRLWFMADPSNPDVRDVYVDKSACDACVATNTTVGAIVDDRNGSCWRQVHPLERTVWDFGYLSMAYGPTDPVPNPFVAVGANGSAYIRLQDALHTANSNIHGFAKAIGYLEAGDRRVVTKTGSDPEAYLQGSMWVGVLGDETDFSALPSISQSASVAVALGAVREAATADDRPVVCGSPGEVAAVPELGNHFLYQSLNNGWVQWGRADLYRPYWTHGVIAPSKLAAFTSVVLSAPDQLRQRVAWALSQQFVISADNGDLDGNTIHIHDIWLSYYDIFVRNAFGSFRDVFKEVSRSRPLPPHPPTTASHPTDVSIPTPTSGGVPPGDGNLLDLHRLAVPLLPAAGRRREFRSRIPPALHDRALEAEWGRHARTRRRGREGADLH